MIDKKNLFIFLITANVVFFIYLVSVQLGVKQNEFKRLKKEVSTRFNHPRPYVNLSHETRRGDESNQLINVVTSTVARPKPLHVQRSLELPINCPYITDDNNLEEIAKADMITKQYRYYRDNRAKHESFVSNAYFADLTMIPDENYIFDKSRCDEFVNTRGYYNFTVTDEEKAFPLAFTIRTYEHAEQFERLLLVIYRPQNVYCVHVDAKSDPKFHEAIKSITRCFPNVFIATKLDRIFWGSYGVLGGDINCMDDLLMPTLDSDSSQSHKTRAEIEAFWSHENIKNKKIKNGWKYLLNLASTEFPLRTNRELVQILTIYNGTNDIQIIKYPLEDSDRFKYHWKVDVERDRIDKTDRLKEPPPFNYTIVKSIIFGSYSRAFIEYAFSQPEPRALLEWLKDTFIADESYFGTLQYNVQFNPPGSFAKIPTSNCILHMTRFMGWPGNYKCDKGGYRRHNLCIFSNGDLNFLANLNDFLANKFQLIDDPIAYSCMEDWYFRRHQRENQLSDLGVCFVIDMTPYCEHLYYVSSGKVYSGCEEFLRSSNDKKGLKNK